MALDKFKYYKIRLDRIDMSITTPLTAKEGAVNGNGIELQLINGSIIENTTGVAVYLNWKHRTTGVQGSEPFTLADAATGLYRVSYPTEMLTGGLVDADIKVVDGTSIAVSTSPILIKVAEAVTDSTTQSENAWNDIQTILVSQQQLKALFEQAIAGVTVDSEVITARQSTVKGKTFTTLDARLEDVEGDAAVMATNLVTNGDFSNGTTGWVITSATGAVSNNIYTFIPTAAHGRIQQGSKNTKNGSKYYFAATVKATKSTVGLFAEQGFAYLETWHSGSGNFERLSNIYTGNATGVIGVIQIREFGTSNFAQVEVQNVVFIDLTSIFGAGKEPTKKQIDWLLAQKFTNSWFNGTAELTSILDLLTLVNTKADKTQEAWITPTLQSGWIEYGTGFETVRYMKDQFGFVHLKGLIKSGTVGVVCMALPVGYRPSATQHIATSSNNAFGFVTINNLGVVAIMSGSNVWFSLSNITFKAEA